MSVAPTLQNLRIGLRKRQEQMCPRSSVEAGQKCVDIMRSMQEQHSSFLRKKEGVCLHQRLNLRNENLLSIPARQCI